MKLHGFYNGIVTDPKSNWLGKTFFATTSFGINNFKEGNSVITKYPFKTYMKNGALQLDYNLKENPWWIRLILDEVRGTNKDKLQGKVNIRIFGILISVGKFNLEKV